MKAFLFLSLILFVFSEEEENESICEKIVTKDACLNQKLDSNDDYCCMVSYQYSEEEEEPLLVVLRIVKIIWEY